VFELSSITNKTFLKAKLRDFKMFFFAEKKLVLQSNYQMYTAYYWLV